MTVNMLEGPGSCLVHELGHLCSSTGELLVFSPYWKDHGDRIKVTGGWQQLLQLSKLSKKEGSQGTLPLSQSSGAVSSGSQTHIRYL